MDWMRSGDVNDILRECHYNDWLWGYAIRTAKTWRTSERDTWRDPVLVLLFRMGSFCHKLVIYLIRLRKSQSRFVT